MDVFDQAQERDLMFRDLAIRNHQQRVAIGDGDRFAMVPVQPRDCEDCDQPIPLTRLSAQPSAKCCTFCQSERERHE
jgi:phage/conjugal plasmid C-4 type zinc finger TraR family protein